MLSNLHPDSILGRLAACVTDPRSRHGRRYPLVAVLGMLLLGVLEGEGSLRGMWLRGKQYWSALMASLGEEGCPRPPALSTTWYLLQRLDATQLGHAWGSFVAQEEEALAADGKHLRGSKRAGARALQVLTLVQVLTLAGHQSRQVLAQQEIGEGDEAQAAIRVLSQFPLQGRLVSLDAGLMEREVVQTIHQRGGYYIGLLKSNQPSLHEAVALWIEASWPSEEGRPEADSIHWDKGHGRLECREVWLIQAEALGAYLQAEYDWPGVTACGWIRRTRYLSTGKTVEEHLWLTSAPGEQVTAEQVQAWLRGHWAIENGVFRVRDVSYDEARLHGRKIGAALSALRNGAMNLIRRKGYRYVPDAWRELSADDWLPFCGELPLTEL